MNHVFRTYLDSFVIVFIDNIIVYLRSKKQHMNQLSIVPQIFRDLKFFEKYSRCKFWLKLIKFLGHVVYRDGIMVDQESIEVIINGDSPTSHTRVCSFNGLANYIDSLLRVLLQLWN